MSKTVHCIMIYGTAGIVETIKIQMPEFEKTVPDKGVREPQPQTSAKATLRIDETRRNHNNLPGGSLH